MNVSKNKWIADFSQIDKNDIPLVGGKGANLGEMTKAGFPVPPGFVVTSSAYYYFLKNNHLKEKIDKELYLLDYQDPENLQRITTRIKKIIESAPVPADLSKLIIKNYEKLGSQLRQVYVAIRSSATAEDLPGASFAGQQETFLNIKGEASVVEYVRKAWASLFTPRAVFYRAEKGFDHFKVGIAIPIQKMIQSEISGIMFTVNPLNNNKSQLVIEAIYGLGELIVQGSVTPDYYLVDKQNLEIVKKQINPQEIQLTKVNSKTLERKVSQNKRKKAKLNEEDIIKLAKIGKQLQSHYFFPQDVEWAWEKKKLYILQTRPITTLGKQAKVKQKTIGLPILFSGQGASPGLVSGRVRILSSASQVSKVEAGEILVAKMTTPDFVPAMRKAVAIITDAGGLTSHAAIVSRELGVPCVVGTEIATQKLKNGQLVTLNGRTGQIFSGQLNKTNRIRIKSLKRTARPKAKKHLKTATSLYVNLADPGQAKKIAKKNVDGIGLLRAEFMIAQIGVHPKKLLADKKGHVFINELAKGLLTFAKAFYPRPVIYRSTDFKTNEYSHLIGGRKFEPMENNPMLGFRGAYRYLIQPEVFELELEAIKKIREEKKLNNLHLMLPFVRTVKELKEVRKLVGINGLFKQTSFKIFMMAEIPSNAIMLPAFIKNGINGVSIGSNDLTQLTLGLDRDNQEIAPLFSENNPAVLWMIKRIIKIAEKYKITSSICGQAPSLYPDFTAKLVSWGITAISVSPDAIDQTREIIHEAEKKLVS